MQEKLIVNLSQEEEIRATVPDINYIPAYKVAEEQRRENELERISNENERETYFEGMVEKIESGYFKGEKGDPGERGPQGETYEITEEDYEEIESQVKEDIQPILEEIENTSKQAEIIAKGRATGYVFDTLEDLDLWLQKTDNVAKLVLGDNLYIRTVGVPDYWWDGTSKQVLETQKVDLTDYAKTDDLPKVSYTYGIYKTSGGILYIDRATEGAIDSRTSDYKPIVPSNLEYAVKSVVGGHVTLTQAQYDALETKDENTYYNIVEE